MVPVWCHIPMLLSFQTLIPGAIRVKANFSYEIWIVEQTALRKYLFFGSSERDLLKVAAYGVGDYSISIIDFLANIAQ